MDNIQSTYFVLLSLHSDGIDQINLVVYLITSYRHDIRDCWDGTNLSIDSLVPSPCNCEFTVEQSTEISPKMSYKKTHCSCAIEFFNICSFFQHSFCMKSTQATLLFFCFILCNWLITCNRWPLIFLMNVIKDNPNIRVSAWAIEHWSCTTICHRVIDMVWSD